MHVEELGNRLHDLDLVGPTVHAKDVLAHLPEVVGLLGNDGLDDDLLRLKLHGYLLPSCA